MLVRHSLDEDGTGYLVRVRWTGYDHGSDTWESAETSPENLLRQYERRRRLRPGVLDIQDLGARMEGRDAYLELARCWVMSPSWRVREWPLGGRMVSRKRPVAW